MNVLIRLFISVLFISMTVVLIKCCRPAASKNTASREYWIRRGLEPSSRGVKSGNTQQCAWKAMKDIIWDIWTQDFPKTGQEYCTIGREFQHRDIISC